MQNLKRNMSGNKKSFLRDLVINSERCYNLMAFNSVDTFRALNYIPDLKLLLICKNIINAVYITHSWLQARTLGISAVMMKQQ